MLFDILVSGLTLAGIYFVISFAVTFMYGVGGFPNLAIGPIGLAGAYLTSIMIKDDIHFLIAILAGMGLSALLAAIIQKLVVEPLYNTVGGGDRGRIFVIYGTFGICLLFPAILLNVFRSTMVTMRLPDLGAYHFFNVTLTGYQILSVVMTLVILIVAQLVLSKTKGGTHVRAVTQNPSLAYLMGIDVPRIYLLTSVIAGICAYIGAILWGEIFSLELGSGMFFTLYGFIIAIMGGLGSVYGALVVSVVLGLVLSATSFLIGGVYEFIITTLVLVAVLILKPMGVIPTRREV